MQISITNSQIYIPCVTRASFQNIGNVAWTSLQKFGLQIEGMVAKWVYLERVNMLSEHFCKWGHFGGGWAHLFQSWHYMVSEWIMCVVVVLVTVALGLKVHRHYNFSFRTPSLLIIYSTLLYKTVKCFKDKTASEILYKLPPTFYKTLFTPRKIFDPHLHCFIFAVQWAIKFEFENNKISFMWLFMKNIKTREDHKLERLL